jgi:GAF domain-containing protein
LLVTIREREEHFAELALSTTHADGDLREAVAAIVNVAVTALHADAAGAMLLQARGPLVSMGSTIVEVQQADDFQHDLGQGPCVDTGAETEHVMAADLADDPRWADWAPKAAGLGLRSILSTSLHTAAGRRLGFLTVYGHQPRAFSDQDLETAKLLSAHATATLWAAQREANLRAAVESRTVIGQAEGILMVRYGLSGDQAIAVLRRYSQNTNTKLHELALEVIARQRLPGGRPGISGA